MMKLKIKAEDPSRWLCYVLLIWCIPRKIRNTWEHYICKLCSPLHHCLLYI